MKVPPAATRLPPWMQKRLIRNENALPPRASMSRLPAEEPATRKRPRLCVIASPARHAPLQSTARFGAVSLRSVRPGGTTSISPSHLPGRPEQFIRHWTRKLKAVVPALARVKSANPDVVVPMLRHVHGGGG